MQTNALFNFTYGLFVISSKFQEKTNGCIINTATQVTSTPKQIAVTISKNNFTTTLIQKSGLFVVSILTQDATMDLIANFGFQSGVEIDKFASFQTQNTDCGIPYLTEKSNGMLACKVTNTLDLGSHILFVGEVSEDKVICDQPSMTYAYYQTVIKGTTPKNAPSFKETTPKTGFKCTICGHIHPDDCLPENFICPICKKDASYFEKINH